jgi:hypothetical protein
MRITIRPAIVLAFRSRWGRPFAFAVLAAVRGALFSYYVFVAYCYPLRHLHWLEDPLLWLARLLELPIGALGFVLPFLRSPISFIHPISSVGSAYNIDIDAALRVHMRAGVVAYLVVFHLPLLFRAVRRGFSRRTQNPPSAGVA